jgi:hypothetical protein
MDELHRRAQPVDFLGVSGYKTCIRSSAFEKVSNPEISRVGGFHRQGIQGLRRTPQAPLLAKKTGFVFGTPLFQPF